MATANRFEEMRNENGVLYKLRGKLSKNKTTDIVIVPKTKMAYMHISDYSNASWDNGSSDKNTSKFVSLNMKEADILRNLMYTMDDQVQLLINAAPPAGKKRKAESNQQIPSYYTGMGQQQQSAILPQYDQQSTGGYLQPATAQSYQAPLIQPQQQPAAAAQSYQVTGAQPQLQSLSYQQPQQTNAGYQQTAATVQPFSYQMPTENNQDYVNQLFATYQ